jgi:pyruvate/2-oxoglutarate dehydrogenase complex dihydrolipoamide dehydrogenase (E3) component
MKFDYDLIAIGCTPEAIYAVKSAVKLKFRTALVCSRFEPTLLTRTAFYHRYLSQITNLSNFSGALDFSQDRRLTSVSCWIDNALALNQETNSRAYLASLGVDVIEAIPQLVPLPQLALMANERQLRSRCYLIATGSLSSPPPSEWINCLTIDQLWEKNLWFALQKNLLIVGNNPHSLELAQIAVRLGKKVTLALEESALLPDEDSMATMLIQAQLEADGVKILTSSPISQVQVLDNKQWVQAGDRAIEIDTIILGGKREPQIGGLNLEGVGVKYSHKGIMVNDRLQTTNPRIYACGDVLGGYPLVGVGWYEANIALKNALGLSKSKVDYRSVPWAIFTEPNFAKVGMTEAQARKVYQKEVRVLGGEFKYVARAQLLDETTGFIKLILRTNGEILGGYIIGSEAAELISTIALAIVRRLKFRDRDLQLHFPTVFLTFSEIFQQGFD